MRPSARSPTTSRTAASRSRWSPVPTGVRTSGTFQAVDGATRVTMLTRGDSTGLFKIANPLLQRIGSRQMAADLAVLKDLLETPDVDVSELA